MKCIGCGCNFVAADDAQVYCEVSCLQRTKKTGLERKSAIEPIAPTEKSALKKEGSYMEKEEKKNLSEQVDITINIEKKESDKELTGKSQITPCVDLREQSMNALEVTYQSMSLLDDTTNHLHGLMKGLHANMPAADIKAYDPERVNASVGVAKQLYQLLRLKFDVIKELRG